MAAWWLKLCDDHWEVHAFRGNSKHKGCETRVSPGHAREHEEGQVAHTRAGCKVKAETQTRTIYVGPFCHHKELGFRNKSSLTLALERL